MTAVHLGTSTKLDDFSREAFQRLSVRLVSTAMLDKQLIVAEHTSPTQPE